MALCGIHGILEIGEWCRRSLSHDVDDIIRAPSLLVSRR